LPEFLCSMGEENSEDMNTNHLKLTWLTTGLLVLSILGQAQSPVRDSDNEARNAYQEVCTTTQRAPGFGSCTLPALPSAKRLAIRYAAATCRESGSTTRNPTLLFVGRIDSVTSASSGPLLIPTRVNARQPFYVLAQPVFLHSDSAVQAIVIWEGEGNLDCTTTTFGYLIDKP
jgi:hypothetical protein